jgi:hypothetical protein
MSLKQRLQAFVATTLLCQTTSFIICFKGSLQPGKRDGDRPPHLPIDRGGGRRPHGRLSIYRAGGRNLV